MMPEVDKDWNVAALSERFRSRAQSAESYLEEIRSKASTNRSYQLIHDQTLAEYYVYNYLHGRTCLLSRAALLAELRSMVEWQDERPYGVFEAERFVAHRQLIVENLIREFESPQSDDSVGDVYRAEARLVSSLDEIRDRVIQAARHWNESVVGDANLFDVYFHARSLEGSAGVVPPAEIPGARVGIYIVEAVEANFIAGSLIRFVEPPELGARAERLIQVVAGHEWVRSADLLSTYLAALYTWHGCLNMAKSLRTTHVTASGEAAYTTELRRRAHDLLRATMIPGERRTTWIEFGMSIARPLERSRNKPSEEIHDDWVPADSPYWRYRDKELSPDLR